MPLLPGRYDFPLYRGNSYPLVMVFKDADGNPIDLSSFTDVRMSIAPPYSAPIRYSMTGGDVTVDAAAGKVSVTLKPADTRMISPKAPYEIEMWAGPDDQRTWVAGTITGLGGANDD